MMSFFCVLKKTVLWSFWAIVDLKFGPLAKIYVGYTSPDPQKRLGVEFPEVLRNLKISKCAEKLGNI